MQYLKPALLDSLEEQWDLSLEAIQVWMKECPQLANALNYKGPEDAKNIISIEIDSYCEEHDIDAENLEKEFTTIKKSFHPTSQGQLLIEEGKLADGSKVLYYYWGLTSGYVTRKEWLLSV